jgi:glycosyltransferase involved in cell wall biosynthesis
MFNASGIGVYLRGCLPFFLKSDNSFLLIGDTKQLNDFTRPFNSINAEIIDCKIKTFSVKELFFFPGKILKKINKADCYYSPFFNIPCGINIPVYSTIHDIIFPDLPELSSKIGLMARMWFFRRAYKKSKKIFTVSDFSKSRIEYHLGSLKPVFVTHSAIQQMFLEYRSLKNNIKKKNNIIFIGNIKKHKGLYCLLDAFYLAKKEGLSQKLIIIGSKDNFRSSDNTVYKKIEAVGDDSITFSGYVNDETLMDYLSSAALLVQPSLYEGFCLPPLEAMVLGTQALISDIPVLKEVYSEYPVKFFRAGDSLDLKEKMLELLQKDYDGSVQLTDYLINKYNFGKTASIILKEVS